MGLLIGAYAVLPGETSGYLTAGLVLVALLVAFVSSWVRNNYVLSTPLLVCGLGMLLLLGGWGAVMGSRLSDDGSGRAFWGYSAAWYVRYGPSP